MKNYVTNIYKYNDIVWGDVEKILHENFISNSNKFAEFKIYVSCKINDVIQMKLKVYHGIKNHLKKSYFLLKTMTTKS